MRRRAERQAPHPQPAVRSAACKKREAELEIHAILSGFNKAGDPTDITTTDETG